VKAKSKSPWRLWIPGALAKRPPCPVPPRDRMGVRVNGR
jgi:hypothetical protein